jgi:hypothetical protein
MVLWLISGFHPVATFFAAWENQGLFLQRHAAARQYPRTVPYDFLDFLLGAGWISLLLVLFTFIRTNVDSQSSKIKSQISNLKLLLCVIQPLFVALLGHVQTETARVWVFMLPLWAIPIGLELERWPTRQAIIPFVALWLLTAVIGHNMMFISL